jgi:hypothetical protein
VRRVSNGENSQLLTAPHLVIGTGDLPIMMVVCVALLVTFITLRVVFDHDKMGSDKQLRKFFFGKNC